MSSSVSPTPHPLKLQSYVIRVTPNRLWQKNHLVFYLGWVTHHSAAGIDFPLGAGIAYTVCLKQSWRQTEEDRGGGKAVCSPARLPRQGRGSQGPPPGRERAPREAASHSGLLWLKLHCVTSARLQVGSEVCNWSCFPMRPRYWGS